MSTRTSLGRTSMIVPLTISPAAKRLSLCFMASSMVSIVSYFAFIAGRLGGANAPNEAPDRKSTRLNSSHSQISYAVFCLKKKKLDEVHASLDDAHAYYEAASFAYPGC